LELVEGGALLLGLLALGLGVLGIGVGAEGAGLGAVLAVLVDHHPRVVGDRAGDALGQGLLAGGDLVFVDRVQNAQGGGLVRVGGVVVVAQRRIHAGAGLRRGIGGGIRDCRIHVGVVAVIVAAGGQARDGDGKQGRGGDAFDVVHWN